VVGSIDLNAVLEEITRRITAINIDESLKTSMKRSITLQTFGVRLAIMVKIPVLCIGLFTILIFMV
jgi:hypothetical protein